MKSGERSIIHVDFSKSTPISTLISNIILRILRFFSADIHVDFEKKIPVRAIGLLVENQIYNQHFYRGKKFLKDSEMSVEVLYGLDTIFFPFLNV